MSFRFATTSSRDETIMPIGVLRWIALSCLWAAALPVWADMSDASAAASYCVTQEKARSPQAIQACCKARTEAIIKGAYETCVRRARQRVKNGGADEARRPTPAAPAP